MISTLNIANIRGIREGTLKGLSPLSVLVGRNGCGKSTVLDALEFASSRDAMKTLMAGIDRRTTDDTNIGAKWLMTNKGDSGHVSIIGPGDATRTLNFTRTADGFEIAHTGVGPIAAARASGWTNYGPSQMSAPMPRNVRFIDMRARSTPRLSPHDLYSEARAAGRKKTIMTLLQALLPGVDDLEILTIDQKPTLFLGYADGAIPLSLSGDGIRNIALLAFELGVEPDSLMLVEEPETHLHPGAMVKAAEAMIHAVRPNPGAAQSQLVLATHSLEFIDALVRAAQSLGAVNLLSVHRLGLERGQLNVSSFTGELVLDARAEAELELR